jgi:hypothetical protein
MFNHEELEPLATGSGYALGGIGWMLRLEGLSVLVISSAAFWQLDGNWWWFLGLLLWPDLAFLAYIKSPRVGAQAYNALHSYIGPLAVGLLASLGGQQAIMLFVLIWVAHIGLDRFVGYGLKYSSQPSVTHLGAKSSSES